MVFETVVQDIRTGARGLLKDGGLSTVAVLALALGIATATTMFTLFDGVMLRPLPFFQDEDSLLVIRTVNASDPAHDIEFSLPDFYDLRAQNQTLSGVLTNESRTYILNNGDRPKRILGTWTTVDAFQTLGVRPIRGRLFRADEAKAGAAPVVLLSYNLWMDTFGGQKDIVGRTIGVNNGTATVIGVMPENFHFPDTNDLWQPYPEGEHAQEKYRDEHDFQVYARMKPGVTLKQVQADLDVIAARLAAAHPLTNTGVTFRAMTIRHEATRDVDQAMRLMMAAVVAVLLISCANVANLLLARGATRAREFAVRLALGAHRWRVVRQVLTESLLLGTLGGLVGLLLSSWLLDFVLGLMPKVPYWLRFDIDWRITLFLAVTVVGTSVLFGTFPALHLSQSDIARDLKESMRGATGSARANRVRGGLVIGQMALALVLLVLGTLTMRSFLALEHTNPGISTDHVLTFRTGLPTNMGSSDAQLRTFFDGVIDRLNAIPGVESAGFVTLLPLTESRDRNIFLVEGMAEPASTQDWPIACRRIATPGVFATLRIPLLRGRLPDEHDRNGAELVAVVDQAFAHRFFPHGSAIGKRITFDERGPKRDWITIVGVVGDVVQRLSDQEQDPEIWIPFAQDPNNFATAVMRVKGEPNSYLHAAEKAVLAVRPDIPIYNGWSMVDVADRVLWKQKMFGSLFAAFAGLALLLATIGIYGVMSYSVTQRRQEIGVRMALGAQSRAVVTMVIRQGLRLIMVGLLLGFAGAWITAQLLTGLLHGIDPHDPPTFAFVPLLLTVVALLACYVPGLRATQVDPLTALRTE